ncbi:MAG: hypothetical protein LBH45_02165 [Campylobacteraceae bacterium]|jgi:hypothetical protein|nr:hypothetical protein [Campylobacteraceae bacterium]
MKIENIPQEGNKTHAGAKKALYAQDETGEYKITSSFGWEAEEIATLTAIEELKRKEEEAKESYFAGKLSPLPFYMYQKRMDLTILSCASGICKWRIKRHFKPSIFAKLCDKTLLSYAKALDIDIKTLREIKKDNIE